MARVLYLVTSSGVGGTELALWQLLRHLDRTRWNPALVSLKPLGEGAARIRDLGIETLTLGVSDETGPYGSFETLLAGRRLPRLLGGRRFDIVHAFLFRANLLSRLAAPRLGRPPLVNAVRVTPEEESPWMRRVDRWTAPRVARFHLQSEALAAGLRARLGVGRERCAVIPNGIPLADADAALAAARPGARTAMGLFRTDLAVACVGRLHRQKGLSVLLAAFHALLQTVPTARLLLAGDGPERRALEAAVDALRLRPFVRFLGTVPSSWELLAAADLFALPSLWEGMPNALLEAMAAGLPVVATAVGAVPEMVAAGTEGLLVPPGDAAALAQALAGLAADPQGRRELGRMARQRVERDFRIEATVAGVERLYGELLSGQAAARRE